MTGIQGLDSTGGVPASSGTPAPDNKVQSQQNQFLQLLVAQLKGQNPLDPLDGTQFVAQLAQFSSLQELTGIHAVLNEVKAQLGSGAQSSAKPL